MAELAMLAKTHCQCLSENQRNRGILVNISFLTYLFTYELEMMSMSIVHFIQRRVIQHLYCAECAE